MKSESVSQWFPISATLLEWQRLTRSMRQLEVSSAFDDESRVQHGETLWGAPCRGTLVTLAWRWREVNANVLAIDNPMTISSNVVLLDERGREITQAKRILHLNNAVHRFSWQAPIATGTKRRRQALAA